MKKNPYPGKLIVLEGTDGSGKGVQTKLLVERLQKEGYKTATTSFPQYGKKSSGPIEEYLNGKYGKPDEVNPYVASLFYAVDRFDLSKEMQKQLGEGHIIILDRYVDSNAGHQGGKIKDPEKREKFIKWLYETEYGMFGIPRPDLTVILHMPAEIGQKLVLQKQQRLYLGSGKIRDGHEDNLLHLKNAEAAYLWLAGKYTEDHVVIECAAGDSIFKPEVIHEKIWKIVEPAISETK